LPRAEPTTAAASTLPEAEVHPLALPAKLLPELSLAVAALALQLWPEWVGPWVRESLTLVALTEVMLAMFQASLTDIATRLRRRPPWWAVVAIGLGLVVMYPEAWHFLAGAFREGWPVFVPFAWSMLERLSELWTMPRAPQIEKLRRRALVSGRLSIVLVFGGAAVAVAGVTYALDVAGGGADLLGRTAGWWLGAAFALAALDVVRVHLPAFARRPRALVPGLDPLGVDYLAPL
jgi:hypothetical protein